MADPRSGSARTSAACRSLIAAIMAATSALALAHGTTPLAGYGLGRRPKISTCRQTRFSRALRCESDSRTMRPAGLTERLDMLDNAKARVFSRLRLIEGQVRSVSRMIEADETPIRGPHPALEGAIGASRCRAGAVARPSARDPCRYESCARSGSENPRTDGWTRERQAGRQAGRRTEELGATVATSVNPVTKDAVLNFADRSEGVAR